MSRQAASRATATLSPFLRRCSKELGDYHADHGMYRRLYEQIEKILSARYEVCNLGHSHEVNGRTTRDLEIECRFYPLGPLLKRLESIGLIEQMPGTFAGVGPFFNPAWLLKEKSNVPA